jgi:hypothetical protein
VRFAGRSACRGGSASIFSQRLTWNVNGPFKEDREHAELGVSNFDAILV